MKLLLSIALLAIVSMSGQGALRAQSKPKSATPAECVEMSEKSSAAEKEYLDALQQLKLASLAYAQWFNSSQDGIKSWKIVHDLIEAARRFSNAESEDALLGKNFHCSCQDPDLCGERK